MEQQKSYLAFIVFRPVKKIKLKKHVYYMAINMNNNKYALTTLKTLMCMIMMD